MKPFAVGFEDSAQLDVRESSDWGLARLAEGRNSTMSISVPPLESASGMTDSAIVTLGQGKKSLLVI